MNKAVLHIRNDIKFLLDWDNAGTSKDNNERKDSLKVALHLAFSLEDEILIRCILHKIKELNETKKINLVDIEPHLSYIINTNKYIAWKILVDCIKSDNMSADDRDFVIKKSLARIGSDTSLDYLTLSKKDFHNVFKDYIESLKQDGVHFPAMGPYYNHLTSKESEPHAQMQTFKRYWEKLIVEKLLRRKKKYCI